MDHLLTRNTSYSSSYLKSTRWSSVLRARDMPRLRWKTAGNVPVSVFSVVWRMFVYSPPPHRSFSARWTRTKWTCRSCWAVRSVWRTSSSHTWGEKPKRWRSLKPKTRSAWPSPTTARDTPSSKYTLVCRKGLSILLFFMRMLAYVHIRTHSFTKCT